MTSQLSLAGDHTSPPPALRATREAAPALPDEAMMLAILTAQAHQIVAEQALHRQAQALALAVHELRNPLVPLMTVASLLERRPDADELPRMGAVVARQVAHLGRLVDDLLDISRVATGKLHMHRCRIELRDVLDQTLDTCRPAIDARRQRFVNHVGDEPMTLHGDPIRLVQAFTNLLQNASKYTLTGGEIVLTCVVGATADRTAAAVISIADNGIGIAADSLPLIFDAFVQDAHAIGFSKEGLGIGLTLVREVVHAHEGTVTAQSAGLGMGSCFTVTLPLS